MRFNTGIGAVALAAAVAFGPAVSPAAAQQETETEMDPTVDLVIATGVENGEPVGEAESFPADVGELFAYLDVQGGEGQILDVVWTYQGNEAQAALTIESDPGTQWTSVQIPAQSTGEWTVEIRHEGSVLTSSTFMVGQ